MSSRRFQRRVEDFVCAVCHVQVVGDGYTNHCPYCLHSRHVDIYPGDRAATCGGIMRPVALLLKHGGAQQVITHRCLSCGYEKNNKTSPRDSTEAILRLSTYPQA